MASVGRIDQAIFLLKARLKQRNQDVIRSNGPQTGVDSLNAGAPLLPLRELVRQRRIGQDDLRKAVVRTLLADALGSDLSASVEFQSIADEVTRILEESESGRNLILRAITELG